MQTAIIIVIIAVAAVGGAAYYLTRPKPIEKVTIRVMAYGEQCEEFSEFWPWHVEKFMEDNPDIILEYVPKSWPNYEEASAVFASGTYQYDIMWIYQGYPMYVEYMEPWNEHLTDYFRENVIDGILVKDEEGNIMGACIGAAATVLYYNTEIFEREGIEKPPETWSEAFEIAIRLTKDTDGDGVIDQWGWAESPHGIDYEWSLFARVLGAYGGELIDIETSYPTFNTREGVEALTMMTELHQKATDPTFVKPDMVEADWALRFARGDVAMGQQSTWMWKYVYEDPEASNVIGKYAVAPHLREKRMYIKMSGDQYFLLKASPNKEAAFKYLEFITARPDIDEKRNIMSGWNVRSMPYLESAKFKEVDPTADAVLYSFSYPDVKTVHMAPEVAAEWHDIFSKDYLYRCYVGEITVEEAIREGWKRMVGLWEERHPGETPPEWFTPYLT